MRSTVIRYAAKHRTRTGPYLSALGLTFFAALALAYAAPASAQTYGIPKQSDWKEEATVIRPGTGWDKRLHGMLTVLSVVKIGDTYFLYYIGADGNRSTDGGPRNRKLGVATSNDGINFTKYSGNPILTYQPHNNQEEGIFSGYAVYEGGRVYLVYGAMRAPNSTSESVDGHFRLAESADGLHFTDKGMILSPRDSSVWGYGDEIFPVGMYRYSGSWHVYYTAKGKGPPSWSLGVASGPSLSSLTATRSASGIVPTYGGKPILIGENKIANFILKVEDGGNDPIEVRTASADEPHKLGDPVETYRFGDVRVIGVFLDEVIDKWFLYYLTDSSPNIIKVKTAPAKGGGSSTGSSTGHTPDDS